MTVDSRSQARRPIPEAVAYAADLMSGFAPTWFLGGGWAVDAWLGRQTREHGDVDIVVFHDDHRAIFDHLPGWALVAHDPNVAGDTSEPWNGRPLEVPAHVHVPELGSSLATSTTAVHTPFELEFQLDERSDRDWVLNRRSRITLPLSGCAPESPWGLPTARPEVVLFYKAGGNLTAAEIGNIRPHDEQDFLALLPILTEAQRSWLQRTLARAHPNHPWLTAMIGLPPAASR